LRHIAGNQTCIDGADRRADDPVRLDSSFVQRLIDTGLIGTQCAAALQYQHDLAGQRPALRSDTLQRLIALNAVHVTLPSDASRPRIFANNPVLLRPGFVTSRSHFSAPAARHPPQGVLVKSACR
jgi:hypothetical protein